MEAYTCAINRMTMNAAYRWNRLQLMVLASAAILALSHAFGIATWVVSTDATFIGYVAQGIRRAAPRPATLLLVAVALFLLNAVATYFMPNVWKVHAVLARISFIVLIASQIAFFVRYMMRRDWYIAWGTLVAAIVLFVLPKYFHIDIMMNIAGFDVNIILGLSEVAYLALFYSGMYRMISVAAQETNE